MKTLFLSHRGESDDAPENTLAAYQLAMARDSDGIELDVRLTKDRQLICLHDEDLKRVAGADVAASRSTLAQLRRHHPVPLLREALAVLAPGKMVQIELKGSPGCIPFCRRVLDAWGGNQSQVVISSFEEETIAAAAGAFPELPRVLLAEVQQLPGGFSDPDKAADYLETLHCGLSFRADFAATPEFVARLHARKMRVVCWGVFSDELGLRMAELGVDAMTCNHAVALRSLWQKRQALQPRG